MGPRIAAIDDIRRIEEVPLQERIRVRSTYEMILHGARGREDQAAIRFFSQGSDFRSAHAVTYRQFIARIHQTANLLHEFGIGPGDAVTILLPNLPQTHFAIWGAEAAGIANPVNPLLGVPSIAAIMNVARSKALIALGPVLGSDIWEKAMELPSLVPSLETIFQVLGPASPYAYPFDELLDRAEPSRLISGRQIQPEDVAAYFHTGGTTGTPKLAQHTHRNQVFNAWATSVVGGTLGGEAMLCGLPLFHTNAVIVSGLVQFSRGAEVVLLSPQGYRDSAVLENFFEIVENFSAASFSAVPTIYSRLLEISQQGCDLSSLRFAICGASPMPTQVFEAFEQATGVRILEGYGLTEGTCVSSCNPKDGERRIGSIGLRLPYQKMKTIRVDARGRFVRDCRRGERGIIAIQGPNVFPGYVQEEANQGIWPQDGWLNTGDLGRSDAEGYFWITGRQKDLIIRGGHNLDPAVIEEALHSHPAVALAAAVGRPDPDLGEVPVAFVTLKPGTSCGSEELLSHCRQRIDERAAQPKALCILPEIPLTPVGKVYKPALREIAQADLAQSRPAAKSRESAGPKR